MSTPTTMTARTPIDEMDREALVAEVQRLREELEGGNLPHPAMWANAEMAVGEAKSVNRYYELPSSVKRAVELLGYLVDIRNWTPQS